MASQQAFQVLQNKGTLIPGQSITVNKVNVQVERYLSQGGFAHVYLVRTATPIYNTTHHVLKRIAVANEAMLAEVKKEVDIMRLLKGHPNIVHLIDAAWHRMPDGLYEVFILMEYCAGGGIIDMMNRRLRERLTETEILQIFVDVCEGVAFMHNLRPALLHRDLKVENILQSSPTSFKLCDFGSATTVSSKAARTTQEIRIVEADLNRHTTLQYRAPEMIDLYLARRIDEKSDVWALGVLLYKLCYYTTPFEEHGPLAILNVQFRFPPYPMYSQDMITLIGSMLREHGSHRPSVFELLSRVHQLRGTKSKYHYSIPVAQPLSPQDQALAPQQTLSPQKSLPPQQQSLHLQHQPQQHRAVPSPNSIQNSTQRQQSLLANSQISYSSSSRSPSRVHGQGIQAREKVLEAIAPMRRGRPETTPHTKTKDQQPAVDNTNSWTIDFPAADDGAWEIHTDETREKQNGMAGEAWHTVPEGRAKAMEPSGESSFGDNFGGKIWGSTDLNNKQGDSKSAPTATPIIKTTAKPPKVPMTGGSRLQPQLQPRFRVNGTDAFEDLGLQSQHQKPAPTLGEARKLRTGLAAVNSSLERQDEKTRVVPRPSPSPRSSYMLQTSLTPNLPNAATSNSGSSSPWRSSPQPTSRPSSSSARSDTMVMESRFPSLEELDANFPNSGYGDGKFGPSATTQLSKTNDTPQLPPRPNRRGSPHSGPSAALKPTQHRTLYSNDGVRSQQVTGTAMRDMRPVHIQGNSVKPKEQRNKTHYDNPAESSTERPSLVRKHPSSTSMKHDPQIGSSTTIVMTMPPEELRPATSRIKSPSRKPTPDWLTGTDDQNVAPNPNTHAPPVLRDSPSKRASVIERSSYLVQEARVQHVPARTSSPLPLAQLAQDNVESPTVSRFNRVFPPVQPESPIRPKRNEASEKGSASMARPETETEPDLSSSADEGPEDAGRLNHVPSRPKRGSGRPQRKGRQSSVHNLVDLWGGGTSAREKDESQELPQPTPDIIDLSDTGSHPTLGVESAFPSTSTPKINHTSASPQPLGGGRPAQQFASTSAIAPPVSSRSRPQSMIIFPSTKTMENNPSSLLDDRKPKANGRRTSITEMVQRYETIGGKPQNPGAPSILLSSMLPPKPVGLKIATQTEAGVHSRNRSGTSLALPNESAPAKGRASPTRHITRSSPVNLLPNNLPQRNQNVETSLRTRTTSAKLDPIRQSASHADVEASPKTDTVPSPERPYPGVNQLIVEWQRKAEAADPSRNKAPYRRGTASGIKRIEGQ